MSVDGSDRWALVLGASMGSGAAIARALADDPALHVFGIHRGHHLEEAKALEEELVAKGRRAVMHVADAGTVQGAEDCADALVYLLRHYSGEEHINVGTGVDVTIRELADLVAGVVGYGGDFVYDSSKPDGTPRKLMDVGRLAGLGWRAATDLRSGLEATYAWYLAQRPEGLRLGS